MLGEVAGEGHVGDGLAGHGEQSAAWPAFNEAEDVDASAPRRRRAAPALPAADVAAGLEEPPPTLSAAAVAGARAHYSVMLKWENIRSQTDFATVTLCTALLYRGESGFRVEDFAYRLRLHNRSQIFLPFQVIGFPNKPKRSQVAESRKRSQLRLSATWPNW